MNAEKKDLFIQGSDSLPTISFKVCGDLKITGRALPENAILMFQPLMVWLKDFSATEVRIEINLDYYNTSVSKKLLEMLKFLEDNEQNRIIQVKWMYEDGDEEMLESGEIYQELLPRIGFSFHKYAEVKRQVT